MDIGSGGFENSSTLTTPPMTQAGLILGTAAYMSPEQARGTTADKRADLWGFGVVLWEMLTGTRLFEGATVSDTLASVLRTEPDWNALAPTTHPAIRRLLRRCLEKDRRRRLSDAADARLQIDEALNTPSADARAAASSSAVSPACLRCRSLHGPRPTDTCSRSSAMTTTMSCRCGSRSRNPAIASC